MTGHGRSGVQDRPESQTVLTDSANLPDLQIALLRDPVPAIHTHLLAPLDPLTKPSDDADPSREDGREGRSSSGITPSDVLSAREAKKPHLAISELVDTNNDGPQLLQLPSFVSLSVVEKSPIPQPSEISPYKRHRSETEVTQDATNAGVEMTRLLPRPSKKDEKKLRPVPLLPAMVTGLHEPPPSAGLLPSMSDARPATEVEHGRITAASRMKVKEIIIESRNPSKKRPPEAMVNSPDAIPAELPLQSNQDPNWVMEIETTQEGAGTFGLSPSSRDNKPRRQYRKWTDQQTADLISGVRKHGSGRWKRILQDTTYSFGERSAVDLKDRYRVLQLQKDSVTDQSSDQPSDTVDVNNANGLQTKSAVNASGKSSYMSKLTASPQRHRKKRQRWTEEEDSNLMAGVAKHGYQWSAIHSDPDMEWGDRRSTDLRDRIRTLFPEEYKRADTRPLARERERPDKQKKKKGSVQHETHELLDCSGDDLPHETGTRVGKRQDRRSSQEKHTARDSQMWELLNDRLKSNSDFGIGNKSKELTYAEQVGITLPSFALDDVDDMEWDNRLAPLLD